MFKNLLIAALLGALALTVAAAVAQSERAANVEIRVWESTTNPDTNYISARPEGGSWHTLGTIPLPLDHETSNGQWRYGDITLAVPVPGPDPPLVITDPADSEATADIIVSTACTGNEGVPCYPPGYPFTLDAGLWLMGSDHLGAEGERCWLSLYNRDNLSRNIRTSHAEGRIFYTLSTESSTVWIYRSGCDGGLNVLFWRR